MIALNHHSHHSVNWQSPVNWSCPWNTGLVLWLLNVPHWQGGLFWRSLEGRFNGLVSAVANWRAVNLRPGGWGHLIVNGSTEYVQVVDTGPLNITGALSVACWFKRVTVVGSFDTLLMKSKSGSKQYAVDFNSGKLRWGDEAGIVVSTTSITLLTWYHALFTYDGSAAFGGLKMYINGVAESTTTAGTFDGIESGTGNFYIASKAAGSEFSSCVFDDVRIWNREISQAEAPLVYFDTLNYNERSLNHVQRRAGKVASAVGNPWHHYAQMRAA